MVSNLEVVKLDLLKPMDSRTNGPVTPATPLGAVVLRSDLVVQVGDHSHLYATHAYTLEDAASALAFCPREVANTLVDNIATALREELKTAVKKFTGESVDNGVSKS